MTIQQKLERSKSDERIDYPSIGCLDSDEPLVGVQESEKIRVEPIWTMADDFEGTLYAEYIAAHPEYDQVYVRAGVYERLIAAAASLPSHLQLSIHAGHRPLEVQIWVLELCKRDYLRDNPQATEAEALAHARTYVSDPAIKLPPHCCGAAVDVQLYDTKLRHYVNFGSPLNLDEGISHLHSDHVTDEQKQNRMLLLKAMLAAGFTSYYAEWWHFSYGDQIWAWFYGKESSLYGMNNSFASV